MTPSPLAAADPIVERWHDLMTVHARAHCALEKALAAHDLGVSEFEVLDRLAGAAHGKRRMQELAEAVHLSQSALSRVVGRLENDGLVTRAICTDDRRGIWAMITDAGRERHAAAQACHRETLAGVLGAP